MGAMRRFDLVQLVLSGKTHDEPLGLSFAQLQQGTNAANCRFEPLLVPIDKSTVLVYSVVEIDAAVAAAKSASRALIRNRRGEDPLSRAVDRSYVFSQ